MRARPAHFALQAISVEKKALPVAPSLGPWRQASCPRRQRASARVAVRRYLAFAAGASAAQAGSALVRSVPAIPG